MFRNVLEENGAEIVQQQIENVDVEETENTVQPTNHNKISWSHEATLALIATVEFRYDDLLHIYKKKIILECCFRRTVESFF